MMAGITVTGAAQGVLRYATDPASCKLLALIREYPRVATVIETTDTTVIDQEIDTENMTAIDRAAERDRRVSEGGRVTEME